MKYSFELITLVCSLFSQAQHCDFISFTVALYDVSRSNTNIRTEPDESGAVILELNKDDYFEIQVTEIKND